MFNRKLPPPKTRPAQRTIPAGFVAQPVQEPHKDAATMNPGVTAVPSSTSGNNLTSQSAGAQHSSGNTLDETSWLKARTAQVQRNDNDVHVKDLLLEMSCASLDRQYERIDDLLLTSPHTYVVCREKADEEDASQSPAAARSYQLGR